METIKNRMKKLAVMIFALLAVFLPVFPVSAESDLPRLVDGADLLSDEDEAVLLEKLDEISERQQTDVVVVTAGSLEGATAVEFADDFYEYYGYGFGSKRDGIMFLVSMEERDWCISTEGYGITAFTDAGQEYMTDQFISYLSDGDYLTAFLTYAGLCDQFLTQAATGEPYDIDNLPKEPFWVAGGIVLAFVIAFIIALIATGIMRSQLKSVHKQRGADNYVKSGSLNLTKENDLFLYRHVERKVKPKENSSGSSGGSSTHTSSSGRTHGGSSGKF